MLPRLHNDGFKIWHASYDNGIDKNGFTGNEFRYIGLILNI